MVISIMYRLGFDTDLFSCCVPYLTRKLKKRIEFFFCAVQDHHFLFQFHLKGLIFLSQYYWTMLLYFGIKKCWLLCCLIKIFHKQVACRDYPHSRHLCLKFPFNKTSHESHCDMVLELDSHGLIGHY